MKEMRDGETTHAMRDQELQHLVSSSIPSPPFSGLSLINTGQGITVLDPIYSAHLIASIAASSPGTRFQLPIPIPLGVQASGPRLYDYSAAIPVTTTDILTSWVNEQAQNVQRQKQRKVSGNNAANNLANLSLNNNNNNNNNLLLNNNNNHNHNNHHLSNNNGQQQEKKKRGFSVSKANKKNKESLGEKEEGSSPELKKGPLIQPLDKGGKEESTPQSNRDKVFSCPICNRCFGYKHVLQNHERTHTGEKPYFCKICNKRFTRDHHLKTHMRLHTGEKPYNCTHCDKQFVQVANLRRHLRVHTGERPYSCEMCESRFSDSNQLKAHMLIHKGQKPYYCEVCTMRFRRRHHLTQHKCMKQSEEEPGFPLSPPDISPPNSEKLGKRERKSRETRRIIRVAGLPVATVTGGLDVDGFISLPEQTVPEDLSVSSGGERTRNYSGSGSHSSVSGSPSPSGGSTRSSLGF